MSSPTNVNLNDLLPAPKPDASNVEWQAGAARPDPNSPGNYVRDTSACYRYPPVGGVSVITADYSISLNDSGNFLVCNSASPFTLTLPAVAPFFPYTAQGIWNVEIVNIGAGAVTLDPNGLNLDTSASTVTINQGEGRRVSTDGTDYYSGLIVAAGGGGGSGTVTSVAITVPAEFSVSGSPITTSGTLAVTKANESANTVWAGPTSGGAAAPTFRALVASDLPTGTTPTFADGETPSGSINGSNTSFSLAHTPVSGSVKLYMDGVRLSAGAGNDYTISGSTITTAIAPATGSTLLADYRY